MNNIVLVITGPTASGNSGIGIELAKKLNGVVISADSMQIYRGLDIGTAKVTCEEAQGVKHELVDLVDISTNFSVSDYKELCYKKIDEILDNGKLPIIVGGTGLYINAVVNNMNFEKFDDIKEKEIEEKLSKEISDKSDEELYNMLYDLDKDAASRIGKGNNKRIIRALKLNMLGVSKSSIDGKNDLWNKNESKYNFLTVFLDMPRDLLYDRINKRVDAMVQNGVLNEARLVYNMDQSSTAAQAIGYKEFFPYIQGRETLEQCVETLKQKTRNYAKRQITWFKKFQDKVSVNMTKSKEEVIEEIISIYNDKNK